MTDRIQIAILGAGAMGCLYAAYLARNPAVQLTLICHSAEEAALLRRRGILITENGKQTAIPVQTAVSGVPHPPADFLFLFVKAHTTAAALDDNPGLISPQTIVVSLQNGLLYPELAQRFAPEQLVVGISCHNSTRLEPGSIFHAAEGETRFGSPAGFAASTEKTCSLFHGTGLSVTADSDVRRTIWRKLFVNMAINPLTALFQERNGFIVRNPVCRKWAERLTDEALKTAAAEGIQFDRAEILAHIFSVAGATAAGRSSMFQDRLVGRRTEIDYICGAVARLAALHGLEAPCNARLTALVHDVENGESPVPGWEKFAGKNP